MAYSDVERAWHSYLASDNGGRGVILTGHSQGGRMLSLLLSAMDDPAERSLIISAMPIGATITRSVSTPAAGDFTWMPACTSADESGCLVSYSTYRGSLPPPENGRFGRAQNAEAHAVCVNPAALMGNGKTTGAIFKTERTFPWSQEIDAWVAGKPFPTTLFVAVPELISAN